MRSGRILDFLVYGTYLLDQQLSPNHSHGMLIPRRSVDPSCSRVQDMATGLLSLEVWLVLGVWLWLLLAMGQVIRVLVSYLAGARSCCVGGVEWPTPLLGLFALDCYPSLGHTYISRPGHPSM